MVNKPREASTLVLAQSYILFDHSNEQDAGIEQKLRDRGVDVDALIKDIHEVIKRHSEGGKK